MKLHEEVDPGLLSLSFPAMVLQPLLENAVKHGIAGKRGRGEINLVLDRQESFLRCVVRNTVGKEQKSTTASNGTGLNNIRQRLELLYGQEYRLEVGLAEDGWFETELKVPVERVS
jgi:two-component system sensor histidine kinase AlgZ